MEKEDSSSFILTSFLPAFLLPSFHLNLRSSSLLLVLPYSLKPENFSHFQSKIVKRSWVLQECLYRVPEEYDAARELLEYGLVRTSFK